MSDAAFDNFVVEELPASQRSMRIALVTETYPPEINGVAKTIAHVVDGLRARRHDVQLIRPRQGSIDLAASSAGYEELLTRGLPIPGYPEMRMGVPSRRAMVRLWKWRRPDVVHIATEGPLGWSALQAAQALRLPVSSDFRTNFHAYAQHYGVGWLQRPVLAYLRRFHNRAQATMVPSEDLRATLAERGFERLTVVQRGVDTSLFDPHKRSDGLRQQWGVDPDTMVVLSVGRVAAEKNLMLLADAFDAMRSMRAKCQLVVVGDGPMRAQLQSRCPGAIFTGSQQGEALAAHYASADAFLFPSVTETFGNVTLEAMASGLPVLAYRYAAAAKVITHGQDGLLATFNDAQQYVQLARDMAAGTHDLAQLGAAARAAAQSHAWDGILNQIETVLRAAQATLIQQRDSDADL